MVRGSHGGSCVRLLGHDTVECVGEPFGGEGPEGDRGGGGAEGGETGRPEQLVGARLPAAATPLGRVLPVAP
ncbi:hypothetical protein SRO_3521 [Streptomyces rochei]|nr:hypothetical protein SRO_3521 [Streptomyces rochei]